MTTLDALSEQWDDDVIPLTEREPSTELQHAWSEQGVVIMPGLVPEPLIVAYEDEWLANNADRPMGWPYATPYMDFPALCDLVCCTEIAQVLLELIGEPMGVHLNLTGWRSTERNWHFDQYLNEAYVGAFYVAVWIALDDIQADSGPFEYLPGSHRWWPPISQTKMRAALRELGKGPNWPTYSEAILTPIFEHELAKRKATPVQFLAKRGDVLFWHSRLLHRGSTPTNPAAERRALIAHYSGATHRPDMGEPEQHGDGWFFRLEGGPMEYKREA